MTDVTGQSEIYTKPAGVRASPTMSADLLAKKVTSLGITILTYTLGDLEPKPNEETDINDWKRQLAEAEAREPNNPVYKRWNKHKYAPAAGTEGFRAAVAQHEAFNTGYEISPADVRVGNGGKGTAHATLRFLETSENKVMFVAAPGWPTNYDLPPMGTQMVEVSTDGRGLMTPQQLRAQLEKHPNPAVIFINAPSNPTGENYTPQEREALLAVIKDAGALAKDTIVLFDDPYGRLVFDQEPYTIETVLNRGPVEKELFAAGKIGVIRTTSKEWGMADTRVGWLITKNQQLLNVVANAHASELGAISGRMQDEAMAAIHFGDRFVERTVAELKEKRQMLIDGMAKLQFTHMEDPKGTIYGWPDFSGLLGKFVPMDAVQTQAARDSDVFTDSERAQGGFTINGSADMMRYLAYVVGICPVAGAPFHAPGLSLGKSDMHIRFTFCGDKAQLAEGLDRLARAEAKLVTPRAKSQAGGRGGDAVNAAGVGF